MNALVFDLGTTYFKAGVYGASLSPIAIERTAAPLTIPAPLRSEIDPEQFIAAIERLTVQLRERAGRQWNDIRRVSIASQANSFLLLDRSGMPLTPIILWNDRRAADLPALDRQLAALHPLAAAARTGIPLLTAEYLPAKLLWYRQRQPEIWKQVGRICTISEYLTASFTGRPVTAASSAGMTGLLDIHRLRWRANAIARLGISTDRLPIVTRTGTIIGPLDAAAGRSLGLPHDAVMIAGCLDQFAGSIGAAGNINGIVTETTGTVLATVAPADRFDPGLAAAGIFQGPAAGEGRYFRLCFGDISAAILETYRNQLPDQPSFSDLDRDAAAAELPTSMRLDIPHWLANRQVRFIDQTTGGTLDTPPRGQAVRAIQVAVADALVEQVRRVAPNATSIHAAGGAAQSRNWIDLKSQRLGIPVIAAMPEPALRGAAVIAFG